MRQKISAICQGNLYEAEKLANDELDKLLANEKRHPITSNHYYTDNIQKTRQESQEAAIAHALCAVKDDWGGKLHVSNLADEMERLL